MPTTLTSRCSVGTRRPPARSWTKRSAGSAGSRDLRSHPGEPGGYAKTLKVVGTEGSKTFSGQSRIRSILGNVSLVYNRKDGSTSTGWDTLPSGFIYIENNGTDENQVTTFTIYGGGFGHGVGMSQNGAQGMAKQGKTCQEILKFFYDGCGLMDISEVN